MRKRKIQIDGVKLAEAIIERMAKETAGCMSCPKANHVKLIVMAEVIRANRIAAGLEKAVKK
jgi:hypothetical protein